MKTKEIIGILLMIAGIALGVYVGLWLMFIGGIVQIIDALTAESIKGIAVAVGVVKIVFSNFLAWASGSVLLIPGWKIFWKS